MTKKKRPELRLIIVSKRRTPTDEGLARLVSAMVLYRIRQQHAPDDAAAEHRTRREAGPR